jgi:hypothetical protein
MGVFELIIAVLDAQIIVESGPFAPKKTGVGRELP